MIEHLVESEGGRVMGADYQALFALHGNQGVFAAGLPYRAGLGQSEAGHVVLAESPGLVVTGLNTCSAVLYLYIRGGAVAEVVGFHSFNGSLGVSGRAEDFGRADQEAGAFWGR